MSDDAGNAEPGAAAEPDAGASHATPHLPPPSWMPVSVALALALIFVGLLGDVRLVVGPAMWLAGLVLLIASCVVWVRGARREYLGLPEDQQH